MISARAMRNYNQGIMWCLRYLQLNRFDTLSPENPNLHREVNFGIKQPPQSLLSEAAAKHLEKLHQFPDRLLEGLSAPRSAPARVGLTTG